MSTRDLRTKYGGNSRQAIARDCELINDDGVPFDKDLIVRAVSHEVLRRSQSSKTQP